VTGTVESTSVKCLLAGFQKCSPRNTKAKEWLQKRMWKVLQHPPHSPDLVATDFYLFRPFKNFLSGKRIEAQNTLQEMVVQYFTSLGKEH
jgi:hypothetical protein